MLKKFSDKLKNRFQLFADKTTIQGINEVYYAQSTASRSIWWVLVICTNLITGYQVYKAILQYQHQGTRSQSEQLEKGRLYYPPIRLCYSFWPSWIDPDKVSQLKLSKDALLYGLSFLTNVYVSTSYNSTRARSDLETVMHQNGIRHLSQLFNLIKLQVPNGIEGELAFNKTEFNEQNQMCYVANVSYYFNTEQDELLNIPGSKPNGKGFIWFYLFHYYDDMLMVTQNLVVEEYNAYMFKIVRQKYAGIESKFNRETFFNQSDLRTTLFSLPTLSFDFDGSTDNQIQIQPDTYAYDISFSVNVRKWKTSCVEGRQASNGDSSECVDHCQALYHTTPPCTCSLMHYSSMLSNDTLDNLCSYCMYHLDDVADSSCVGANPVDQSKFFGIRRNCSTKSKDQQLSDCRDQCRNASKGCEVWDLHTTIKTSSYTEYDRRFVDNWSSAFTFTYPTETNIFIISEVDTLTWEDFVSNIGGLLGIWMGASILSYVQFVYLCCCSDQCICCTCGTKQVKKYASNKQSNNFSKVIVKKADVTYLS